MVQGMLCMQKQQALARIYRKLLRFLGPTIKSSENVKPIEHRIFTSSSVDQWLFHLYCGVICRLTFRSGSAALQAGLLAEQDNLGRQAVLEGFRKVQLTNPVHLCALQSCLILFSGSLAKWV